MKNTGEVIIDIPEIVTEASAKNAPLEASEQKSPLASPLELTTAYIRKKAGSILGYGGAGGFVVGAIVGIVYAVNRNDYISNPGMVFGIAVGFGFAGSSLGIIAYTGYKMKCCPTQPQEEKIINENITNIGERRDRRVSIKWAAREDDKELKIQNTNGLNK